MFEHETKRRRVVRRDAPSKDASDLEWFVAIGEALFGQQWQAPMAQYIGVSGGHVSGIVAGKKVVSPKTKALLVDALERTRDEIMVDATYRVKMVVLTIAKFRE